MSDREKRLEQLLIRLMDNAGRMAGWVDEPPEGYYKLVEEIYEELDSAH